MHLPFLLLLLFHAYYAADHLYSFRFKMICPPGSVTATVRLLNTTDGESYDTLYWFSVGFDRSSDLVGISGVTDIDEDGSHLKLGINHNCNGHQQYLMHPFHKLPAYDAVYLGHVNLYTGKSVFNKEVQELEQDDSMEEEDDIAIHVADAKNSSEMEGEKEGEETDPQISSFFTPKKVEPDSATNLSLLSSLFILLISLVY